MFLNYGNSPSNTDIGYMNKNVELEVTTCGTYRLEPGKDMEACRPEGRLDYQLIYIQSGRGIFFFTKDDSAHIVEAGNMVLYHPGEFQKYEYSGKDAPNIYWIHFTGAGVAKLFERYGLDAGSHVIPCGTESLYALSFDRIILELQLRKKYFAESAALSLSHIIMIAGRYAYELSQSSEILPGDIKESINFFRENYRSEINIEKYITDMGYSTSSFFRKFKNYTGMTPLQCVLEIRLSYATKLLETTNLSINEISELVGYDNPLYFSRLFHRHVGVSPREYRVNFR